MASQNTDLRWEPRLPGHRIRRLYETDARGIRDEELLDDIAYALYSRCESILTVTEAVRGRVRCPRCGSVCTRLRAESRKPREDPLRCPDCAWEITWGEYRRSYQNKRLFGGGAVDAFRAYVEQFPRARTPQEKMLLIDRLIHAIHNELADRPQRPAAVNLIDGDIRTVTALLEELAYGDASTPGTAQTKAAWRRTRERQFGSANTSHAPVERLKKSA
jgi:predicted RNA-binding Zn-ribbon protein involved in translation (DUF1610 family)